MIEVQFGRTKLKLALKELSPPIKSIVWDLMPPYRFLWYVKWSKCHGPKQYIVQ